MERLIAFLLLILLSPILAFWFILVKLTSKGPFVFRQLRAGRNFKPFSLYKIRTMYENAEQQKDKVRYLNEADGPVFKIKDDPRFTPIGRILSRIGQDEILQLINVIRGEMSFVGPRPLPVAEAKKIEKKYQDRFSIKPGITSLWIIRGAHELTFVQWMESDLEYVRKKSVFLDFYIISVTLFLMFKWIINELQQISRKIVS
ncbi:hypothetical protein A3C98_03205 [Candidatus Roizmanbacteria bacterium RIFCSPHIGHO2_02_FULL_37_15]|uniref:Bacterial sugar transferase domain-containing protein n=1 Tax=Candidatus Roizmanbacteria bacterium RIFCSPLOWO2_01_FULL_37_16 TaxID=1802058 RepID=A0A1F7IQ13_9BACT|nr:MAG: hypothetical protein A2859_00045 [Candidatus Roizmanbacteria bacterium RIFCSPHIGHO2_01_FULL_37_16b]OGK22239.1 MAG: hypothetical protein A3C98_03205 [Candidatus Roizmanbacteria bacterium RIFCSPHIGHO2_02_FULL_37_15]OGK31665.1 MAG: hypothetical protein A3F57_02615 [Candidatus Roizmanbacteria bacterium RIFCSPHIGHO2_12_FULL_36_11]OGK45450.1 MAG: hypothetical protein A3B40_05985 [Candidatus Roizmanbacteria bacterium RIFCSPLOWO2_01_FULL_37_16]OGK56573.1 MAG: hypothetical protein A3I50_01305 [C